MSEFLVEDVLDYNPGAKKAVKNLLESQGIRLDSNLDYTCAVFNENREAIATGSCFKNTLRCFAVRSDCQGQGLLNTILSHLVTTEFGRGNTHLFLYTKISSSKFFRDTGFYEIARGKDLVAFMENRRSGFSDYLAQLKTETENFAVKGEKSCAIVMNANPFTLGHQFLVEKASAENELVHLFVISEDSSIIPAEVRRFLVAEGTKHLKNVVIHNCGPYIISSATFPSYFQKDDESVILSQAELDICVFGKIAGALGIKKRYVGEEPFSKVTSLYNSVMKKELPLMEIECVEVPRKTFGETAISASKVRLLLKEQNFKELEKLVPQTTVNFFKSEKASSIISRLNSLSDKEIVHY